ncbi:DNA cytosine methyltransferase [Micromonospora sp. KC723]|uniref:DNA cytosine methyltransferase n=1 Tax=Micromonospora sp. KC723 TaxID=2530381 RepID=UPI0010491C14|nr:DNA cytosine methyltransferase [Micromonospora sp. KC723]TDB75209.1 DNA cytosine methyltransferase [Micromonospora sp. KC723]
MTATAAEPLFHLPAAIPGPRDGQDESRPLKVIDLFAGAGGLSEGFRQAGFDVVAGSDVDPDAVATYKLNFPEATPLSGDIREGSVKRDVLSVGRGVDVVVGGPPCQAFSQVRNHSRIIDDPRNSLYREFVASVADIAPAAFVMENVPGMAQMGVLEQVVEDLSLGGTYTVEPQVLDAADFGVPQTRKRIVFLGVRTALKTAPVRLTGTNATEVLGLIRQGKGQYEVDGRGGDAEKYLERLADPQDARIVTAAQAISDLEDLEAGRRLDDIATGELPRAKGAYQRLMRQGRGPTVRNVSVPRINRDTVTRLLAIPAGGNHRDLSEELLARYISGDKWGPSTDSGRLGRSHFYAYRRLHPAIWAWTLNTKADSAYHYRAARALSVREFARLQSFPDRFVFTTDERRGNIPGRIDGGATHSRYRQVGNAVPPLLAAAIAREVATLVRTARRRAALG